MTDFSVTATQIDPDYDDNAGPRDVVLRIDDHSFSIVDGLRWVPFRGPRVLQWLLTPICALRGLLTAKADINWTDEEGQLPRMRATPFVPPDFWMEFAFTSREDADSARTLIALIWR